MRRILLVTAAVLVLGLLVIQLVPVAGVGQNPPVTAEPVWDSPETKVLAVRACFDCHSNETRWPWYSRIAPASWMLADHVRRGREAFNLSDWQPGSDQGREGAEEAVETIRDGSMPLRGYALIHPRSRLDAGEQELLIRGLQATLGPAGQESEGEEERD